MGGFSVTGVLMFFDTTDTYVGWFAADEESEQLSEVYPFYFWFNLWRLSVALVDLATGFSIVEVEGDCLDISGVVSVFSVDLDNFIADFRHLDLLFLALLTLLFLPVMWLIW